MHARVSMLATLMQALPHCQGFQQDRPSRAVVGAIHPRSNGRRGAEDLPHGRLRRALALQLLLQDGGQHALPLLRVPERWKGWWEERGGQHFRVMGVGTVGPPNKLKAVWQRAGMRHTHAHLTTSLLPPWTDHSVDWLTLLLPSLPLPPHTHRTWSRAGRTCPGPSTFPGTAACPTQRGTPPGRQTSPAHECVLLSSFDPSKTQCCMHACTWFSGTLTPRCRHPLDRSGVAHTDSAATCASGDRMDRSVASLASSEPPPYPQHPTLTVSPSSCPPQYSWKSSCPLPRTRIRSLGLAIPMATRMAGFGLWKRGDEGLWVEGRAWRQGSHRRHGVMSASTPCSPSHSLMTSHTPRYTQTHTHSRAHIHASRSPFSAGT